MKKIVSILALLASVCLAARAQDSTTVSVPVDVSTSTMSAPVVAIPLVAPVPVGGGGGGGSHAYLDAEKLAQASLRYVIDHYTANLYSSDNNGGGKGGSYFQMQMGLNTDLYITNLSVNDTNIPLPKPLTGIPLPAAGLQNASINMVAWDKYGQVAAQGYMNTNYLAQGGRISVVMTPRFPPVAVQIGKGFDQSKLSVIIDGANGWGWSYDSSTGLVTIYVNDITKTDLNYEIRDGSGVLLGHGSLPWFQAFPGAGGDTNTIFSIQNAGGYITMPLGQNGGSYLSGVKFNSTVTRNDTATRATVICVPDIGNQSKLYVNTYGVSVASIEVRKWTESGSMPLVSGMLTTDPYGNTTFVTSQYLDKAVITVVPANPLDQTVFQVQVSRTY
jgi:hypothetical protein